MYSDEGCGDAWESWGLVRALVRRGFDWWAGVETDAAYIHSWIFAHFEGLNSGFFQKQKEKQGRMSDVINRSALSAMEDFLRAREADSTTEGVLAKVGYDLCYKEPCVIKNLYRQRTCWLQLEQEWLQGWGEGLCSTLVLQVRCKRKIFFLKRSS